MSKEKILKILNIYNENLTIKELKDYIVSDMFVDNNIDELKKDDLVVEEQTSTTELEGAGELKEELIENNLEDNTELPEERIISKLENLRNLYNEKMKNINTDKINKLVDKKYKKIVEEESDVDKEFESDVSDEYNEDSEYNEENDFPTCEICRKKINLENPEEKDIYIVSGKCLDCINIK